MSFYQALEDIVRRIVGAMLSEVPVAQRGIVVDVNPATMQARVNVPNVHAPSGYTQTGWLPIATPCMQNGWGIMAAPPVGAQVIVMPLHGDGDSAVVWGAHWSQVQVPPTGYPVGELWLYHATGAFIKVQNSGGVLIQDQHGAEVSLPGDGTVMMIDPTGAAVELSNNKILKLVDGFGSMITLNGDGSCGMTIQNIVMTGNLTVEGTFSNP